MIRSTTQPSRPHRDLLTQSIHHRFLALPVSIFAGALIIAGCSDTQHTERNLSIENPRTSGGSMVIEDDTTDLGLSRLASALDQLNEPQISPGILTEIQARVEANQLNMDMNRNAEHRLPTTASSATIPSAIQMPAKSGMLIPLERLSNSEIHDLLSSLSLRYQTESGYERATPEQTSVLPALPAGVSIGASLVRMDENQAQFFLRIGFVSYISQLPQLWIQGVTVDTDGNTSVNSDIEGIEPVITASIAQVHQMRTGLRQSDLDRQIIQLSYVNTTAALNVLKGLGIHTVPSIEGMPAQLEFDQLPLVTAMPTPSNEQMGLITNDDGGRGSFGQATTPTKASQLNAEVNVGATSQLMIVYHPAHPEQFSLVRSILDDYVDKPARQVFIEGMVLEISEDGLDELGIEWSFKEGSVDFVLGSLDPTGILDTVTFSNLDSRDVVRDWGTKVRALVRDGKAEILSRPSVLTMNNRQATIRVGEDIPIATSQEGVLNNSNKVAFNFKYIPTGILLNIRPRIAEAGDEVSMLIDTVVSAKVPGRDLEIRSTAGDLLASAPTISTRRVQTYARIDNTTPFIIGGLVSRDLSVSQDKVPFLGDLPLIGPAFRSESTTTQKREVIIVLTPYVLPDNQAISRALPKDDEIFDSVGNQLFRDAFRIHAEDVFDLRFIAENKRLKIYRNLAKDLIKSNYKLAFVHPFDQFANDTIPGEEVLVQRMVYELIKRTEVDSRVNPERIIFFEAKEYEGYHVQFLNHTLSTLGDGTGMESFFERNSGKAVAFTYTYSRESMDKQDLASEPIPEISLVDCPDRDTWQQLLWDMNQPSSDGIDRYTILIQSPRDIVRLSRALMLKKIVQLNGGEEALSLDNFSIGKILHIPMMGEDKVSVIDADVAKFFFHTELYYAAIIKRIEDTLSDFDTILEQPEAQMYLNNTDLVVP